MEQELHVDIKRLTQIATTCNNLSMPREGNVLGGTHSPAMVVTSDKLFWNPTKNKEDMSQTWNL